MYKEGKKCVLYVRVSTEMQVDGFSLDGQRNTLKRFAEREGMIIKDVYEDAGKSGKSIEGRPAFTRLLNDIKNGLQIDYIMVYKLSRFGRNAADVLNSLELIQAYGINLISVEEGIDSSQTSGKLLITMLSAVSEIERENILEQTMNGRKEKARQGGWNGGFAPYGYKLEDGNLLVIPEEAEQVRMIYDLFVNSSLGISGIAKKLNKQGIGKNVDRPNSYSTRWTQSTIKNILDNPIYCGYIAYGRTKREKVKGSKCDFVRIKNDNYQIGKGHHEAIITDEIFNQAKKKREETGVLFPSNVGHNRIHLLSGLIKCPICGGPMHVTKNIKTNAKGERVSKHYYACTNNRHNMSKACDFNRLLAKDKIEPYIKLLVKEIVNSETFISALNRSFCNKVDTNSINKLIETNKKKLRDYMLNKTRLEEQIDTLPFDMARRDEILSNLNARLFKLYDEIGGVQDNISDLENELQSAKNSTMNIDNIISYMKDFDNLYEIVTDEERRNIIRYLFEEIQIYSDFKDNHIIKSVKLRLNPVVEETNESITLEYPVTDEMNELMYNKICQEIEKNKIKATPIVKEKVPRAPIKRKVGISYNRKQPTYSQIKNYIKDTYNMNVSSLYIAQAKKELGLDLQVDRSSADKVPQCPKEKMIALTEAFKHFNML